VRIQTHIRERDRVYYILIPAEVSRLLAQAWELPNREALRDRSVTIELEV